LAESKIENRKISDIIKEKQNWVIVKNRCYSISFLPLIISSNAAHLQILVHLR
jgi:hypothetical protein